MSSASVKKAEAAAKIQFAVHLLTGGIREILRKKFGTKDKLDFNTSLRMVEKHIGKLFADPQVQGQIKTVLGRAIKIRNEYSHQDFDVNQFEHDVECLVKLASLIGLSDVEKKILEFGESVAPSNNVASTEGWEKFKEEGDEHFRDGRWTEAMNCYTKAIRINSKIAVLYSNRALCEIRLSKIELAREDAEDAIELDPNNVEFYRILSDSLYKGEHYKEAIDVCENGLKVDSRDEVLLIRLKDCRALVDDQIIQTHPVHGRDGNLETFINMFREHEENDVSPMDSAKVQLVKEINVAHKILQKGRGNLFEEQKCLDIFESAAKRGSAEGLYNMALMYSNGQAGLARDPKKALDLCFEASKQKPYVKCGERIQPNVGVAEAENHIAIAYRDGLAVDQNDKLAFKWFLRSAQHSCQSAMNNVGDALANGIGCELNLVSARWWYQKAADFGQAEAQFNLAHMLIDGRGGSIDTSKAAGLLKAAADQGLPGALASLQRLVRSEATGAKSMVVSSKIVNEKAQTGDKEALFLLGQVREPLTAEASAPGVPFGSPCWNCGNPSALKQCSKCKKAKYCDRNCQTKHWKEHKKTCSV